MGSVHACNTKSGFIQDTRSERNGEPPDGFKHKDKIVKFFEGYVQKHNLPVLYNTNVVSTEFSNGEGYIVETNGKSIKVKNVSVI